jgi:hypothetical protein
VSNHHQATLTRKDKIEWFEEENADEGLEFHRNNPQERAATTAT